MKHIHLCKAKTKKNDEFYTCKEEIEAELSFYSSSFKDKVVFCNCNDYKSSFNSYFVDNFDNLGLQGLYCSSMMRGELFEYDGCSTKLSKIDGDFRSDDSIAIMKNADIIVTNPPYSLFRPFYSQLLEFGKQFLVIGSKLSVCYKEVFPSLKQGLVRTGYTVPSSFYTPTGELERLPGLSRWFTTLPTPGKSYATFTASMNDRTYDHFDLYPAISVKKTDKIPYDYEGLMGVPISAFDKLDPEEFEFVDMISRYAVIDHTYDTPGHQLTEVDGQPQFSKLIIKKRNKEKK